MARYVSLIPPALARQSQEPINGLPVLAFELAKILGQVHDATQAARIGKHSTRHDQFTRLSNTREQYPFGKVGGVIASNPQSVSACHLATMHSA
jgi:hypothetical protein